MQGQTVDMTTIAAGVCVALLAIAALSRLASSKGRSSSTVSAKDPAAELDKARRFARAVAADVALYNATACEEARRTGTLPATLVSAVDEGRALFRGRVPTPSLHHLYDEAVDALVLQRR